MSTVIPVWANGAPKPARVRLIHGKTELLLGMNIVRELYATLSFGGDRFRVGHGACEMMTSNEKSRWLFPLFPTACACAKLNGYLGKLRNSEIDVLQSQGDFGENVSARKVLRQKQRSQGNMEIAKAIISEMWDTIQNALLRSATTISGCYGGGGDLWYLREIEKMYNLVDDFENLQKGSENLENLKNIADFEEEKEISQLPKGKAKK